jgi:hypothetical protein
VDLKKIVNELAKNMIGPSILDEDPKYCVCLHDLDGTVFMADASCNDEDHMYACVKNMRKEFANILLQLFNIIYDDILMENDRLLQFARAMAPCDTDSDDDYKHYDAGMAEWISTERIKTYANLMAIAKASKKLIDSVKEKYGVESIGDFICPIHKELAQALEKIDLDKEPEQL